MVRPEVTCRLRNALWIKNVYELVLRVFRTIGVGIDCMDALEQGNSF